MKKYVYLILSTILVISIIVMSGFIVRGQETECEVFTVTKSTMENTVTASGRLRYSAGTPVKLGSDGIIGEIYVKNGDSVASGDPLMVVYKLNGNCSALLSKYGGVKGAEALLGMVSGGKDTATLIEEAKKYCEQETITSDRDGTVSDLSAVTDQLAEKNAVLMKITDKTSLEVPVNVSESVIGRIEKDQKATVEFNAIQGRTYSGKVVSVSDEASQTGGLTGKETTVEVIVSLDEYDSALKAGYSALCSIVTSIDKDVMCIPYDYLLSSEEGSCVYLYKDGTARKTPVETGTEYRTGTAVLKGLHQGDKIITDPEEVSDGQKVRIKKQTGNDDV